MLGLEVDKTNDNEKKVQKVNNAALREKIRKKFFLKISLNNWQLNRPKQLFSHSQL